MIRSWWVRPLLAVGQTSIIPVKRRALSALLNDHLISFYRLLNRLGSWLAKSKSRLVSPLPTEPNKTVRIAFDSALSNHQ